MITVLVFMNILSNLMHPTIGLWDGSMFSVHRTGIHEHLVKPHAPYIPKGNGMGQCSVFIVTETCFEIVENLPGSMGIWEINGKSQELNNLGKTPGTRKSGRGNKPQSGISLRTNNSSQQLNSVRTGWISHRTGRSTRHQNLRKHKPTHWGPWAWSLLYKFETTYIFWTTGALSWAAPLFSGYVCR